MSPRKKEKTTSNPHIRFAKEKKKNKLIVIGFIITAALILGMVGYAILYATVLKDNIPVAKIDGLKVDNEFYKARVRFDRNLLINNFQYYYYLYKLNAEDPNSVQYYEQQLQQIASTLNDYVQFGETVLYDIIDDEIIAMQGKEMGIEISESEIDAFVQQNFNYFPDGTPTPEPQPTAWATPTMSRTQEAILGINPTQGVEETESLEPTLTTAAPTQTPGPTATPYTEELFQEIYDNFLSDLSIKKVSENNIRKFFFYELMNQKVRDAVVAEVPIEQEQIWARHILVPTHDEAIIVILRLEEESWNDVAADVSLDTSNKDIGGDLRWFTRGRMVSEFDEASFGMEVGQISEPIETQFGWHIIQLVDRDNRQLSQADYEYQQNIYFDDWFAGIKENIDIKINDVWKDIVPDDPAIQ